MVLLLPPDNASCFGGIVMVMLLLFALTAVMLADVTSGPACGIVMTLLFAVTVEITVSLVVLDPTEVGEAAKPFSAPLEILLVIANKLIGVTSLAAFPISSGITVYLSFLATQSLKFTRIGQYPQKKLTFNTTQRRFGQKHPEAPPQKK
jgi:hypothetical protein